MNGMSGFGAGLGGGLGAVGAHKAIEKVIKNSNWKTPAQRRAVEHRSGVLSQQVEQARNTGNTEDILRAMQNLADYREREISGGDKHAFDMLLQAGELSAKYQKWAQAEAYYRRALANCARRKGPGAEESVPVLNGLVNALIKQDKSKDAANFSKQALAILQKSAPDDPQNQQRRIDTAQLCIQSGDLSSAESLLKTAIAAEEKAPTTSDRLATMTATYKSVLEKLGQPADAMQPSQSKESEEE